MSSKFDQRWQNVTNQYNIAGDLIINTLGELDGVDESVKHQLKSIYQNQICNSPEKAKYYFALGLNYLDLSIYDLSINSLQAALEKGPREANILYYLALAYVGGKRPKTLKLSTVRVIDNYLGAAIQLDNSQAHYLYLWALIKYDYYLANGLKVPSPSVEELLFFAQKQPFIPSEVRQMLKHISIPNDNPIKKIMLKGL
jgi:tetratricopeptide (TPR) repeat protein